MKKEVLLSLACTMLLAVPGAFGQCPSGQTQVHIALTTDNYGSETSWTLTGVGGSPVYGSGGSYSSNQTYNVDVCVPDGPVVIFTIFDAYGDGICCNYGNGSYTVTANGNTMASGGQFTTSQASYFLTSVPVGLDMACLEVNMEDVIAQGNQTVAGVMRNFGTSAITSFTLNYSVDGGAAITQNITANVAPGANYTFSHSTPWNSTVGLHNVKAWASNLNSAPDANPLNDQLQKTVSVASQTVARTTLVEEFTSSTCVPCANFNVNFDPTLSSLNTNAPGSHVAAVKYQMNWPSPGNDPSYNGDGNTRKSYYGVNGIPKTFLDGNTLSTGSASLIQAAAAKPAFVSITLSHTMTGPNLSVTANVTPYAEFPGTYKLYITATENSYYYPASTTTQDYFHYVERKMMPNGNGNTMAAMTPGNMQSFTQSHTFTLGGPAQGNNNLWGQNLGDVTVVAYLQNTTTKAILQAATLDLPTGVSENQLDQHMSVGPNPAGDQLDVMFDLPGAGKVQIDMFNVLGERVSSETRTVAGGFQREGIDTSALNEGVYFLNITSGDLRATRKITIAR